MLRLRIIAHGAFENDEARECFVREATVGRAGTSPQLGRCISPQIGRGALPVRDGIRRWRNPVGTR